MGHGAISAASRDRQVICLDGSYLGRGEIPFLKSSDLPSEFSTHFLNSSTAFLQEPDISSFISLYPLYFLI